MTRLLSLLVLLAIIVAVFLYLKPADQYSAQSIKSLPWQIDLLPDGASRVFGITLGRNTLDDARAQLGDDMELAIVAVTGDDSSLEMFYSRFTAGVFSGKLVLSADISDHEMERLLDRAVGWEYLKSGARKYRLASEDLPVAWRAAVRSITFVPDIKLDERTALKHFGTPAEIIRRDDHVTHLLYPEQGLDLVIDERGKDILQYVAPRNFATLRNPLL